MSTALPSLRQLRYLVTLADRLNFRQAAEASFVTQSTLSAGIKELETLIGVELVERDTRGVRLTAAGAEVVARARTCIAPMWLGLAALASFPALARPGTLPRTRAFATTRPSLPPRRWLRRSGHGANDRC